MGRNVVLTYKRKRLFSRSDHSLVNLHSDTSCQSAKSKTTDNLTKQEGSITECTLVNNGAGLGSRAHSKDDVGEDGLQCENRDSHCCNQCLENHARKPNMHYSSRAEHKDSSISGETEKFTPEQKCPAEADSCSQSNAVKSSFEHEATEKILTVPQPPDACTPEASTLEETDKLNTEQYSRLCNKLGIKRKLSSTLITFCRRSKRSRAGIAINSATLPAASCSLDIKNEKELLDGNYESCSFSVPAPATSTVVLADNRQHCPPGEAEDPPIAAVHGCHDPHEQKLELKICMDIQDNFHINATNQLLDEDVKSRRMHGVVSERADPMLSLDLSAPPHASHNISIDCNLPLDNDSNENQPIEIVEDHHDSLGSTSKINEDISSLPVQHLENGSLARSGNDKGKCILDSPSLLTYNSSKNNYIQFLPESRSDSVLQSPNNSEKVTQIDPSSLQSSTSIGLSLHPDQMVDGRACFPPSYEWPSVQIQPRESFRDAHLSTADQTQSFARDKMMLDNILSRARAVRGNRSTLLDKFEFPTTWLDEELDSLWIGVRRHGRGNWDAILGDRRLNFLPWKTSWDLAERWQVEQSRLLCSMPTSQRRYASPPDLSSEHLSSLHHPWPEGQSDDVCLSLGRSHPVQNGIPPLHFTDNKTKRDLCEGSGFTGDESSSTAGLIKGSLPHRLRTAAEIPLVPTRPVHAVPSGLGWLNQPSPQPWLSNRYISTQRRPEPDNSTTGPCSGSPLVVERANSRVDEHVVRKQEDLIIIPSDASSEETISDDHSIRP